MMRPVFMSWSRSPHWLAAPPVTLAAMRLAAALPGEITPNMSWVTLPMGPTGVTPVSPETRPATMASRKVSSTPRMAVHHTMPNRVIWVRLARIRAATRPRMNHLRGTSWLSVASPAPACPPVPPLRAATTERQEKAKLVREAVTIMATPGHSIHLEMGPYQGVPGLVTSKPSLKITQPISRAWGASTPQATTAPSSMETPARNPIRAPTATSRAEGSQAKVRFLRL